MVAGRNVLLLVGVISSFSVDTGFCARIRRRDGNSDHRLRNSPPRAVPRGRHMVRAAPEVIIPRDDEPPAPPRIESALPESVTVVKSVSVAILASSSSADAQIPGTQAPADSSSRSGEDNEAMIPETSVAAAAQSATDGGSSVAAVISEEIKPSLSAGGMKLGAAASSSTTEAQDYIYPGIYGAGGTLTTDSRAPTRSVAPSKNSVPPKQGSLGPPPMDPSPRPGVPAPPAAPPVDDGDFGGDTGSDAGGETGGEVGSDIGASHGPPEPILETPPETQPAAVIPGPPRTRLRPDHPVRPTVAITQHEEASMDLGYPATTASPLQNTTITWYGNSTFTKFQPSGSATVSYCQASDYVNSATAITTWSVVYTSTVTWTGDPKAYTPPFAPIVTPPPEKLKECVEPLPPPRLTLSYCTSTGTGTKYVTCIETTSEWNFGPVMSTHTAVPTATIVFLTTDKNPAVVFSPIQTPNYGVTTQPRTKDPQNNHGPTKNSQTTQAPPPYNSKTPQQPQPGGGGGGNNGGSGGGSGGGGGGANPPPQQIQSTQKPVTVVVRPSAVIIDGNTISDRPPVSTQVVIVGGRTFTIEPSRVIGEDATITRPASTGGVFAPAPTSRTLGGILVQISSDIAVVDGTQYTIGPVATTVTGTGGKPVVIGTGGVIVGEETLGVPNLPMPTEVVVAGGELITAIGKSIVVIYGTTITYGLSDATSVTTIGDDTITLGPSGIVPAPGTTLGGSLAKAGETAYALVGGVTITEIGESVLVINEVTYTVGPGASTITTEFNGERVTIGPAGVTIDTLTFPYPFGASSTTIIPAVRPVPSAMTATKTGYINGYGYTGSPANPEESKDAAPGSLIPGLRFEGSGGGIVSLICIAIGVVIFGL